MLAHSAPMLAPKTKPTIYYPETDHQPIPEGTYLAPIYRKVVTTLENHFRKTHGANVNGNVFIYYEEGNPQHPRPLNPPCPHPPKSFCYFSLKK